MSVCDERDNFAEIWLKSMKKLEELHKSGQIERSSHWALSLLSLPPPPLSKAFCIRSTAHIFVDPEELMKTQWSEWWMPSWQTAEHRRTKGGWVVLNPTNRNRSRRSDPQYPGGSVIFCKTQWCYCHLIFEGIAVIEKRDGGDKRWANSGSEFGWHRCSGIRVLSPDPSSPSEKPLYLDES